MKSGFHHGRALIEQGAIIGKNMEIRRISGIKKKKQSKKSKKKVES